MVGWGVEEGGEWSSAEAGEGAVGGRVEAGQRHLAPGRLLLAGAQRLVAALQHETCTQRPQGLTCLLSRGTAAAISLMTSG